MTDSDIINAAFDLHAMGFKGFIGFHFYSEPMNRTERMKNLIPLIKSQLPGQRFLLWTNAVNFVRPRKEVGRLFEVIILSIYDELSRANARKALRNAQEVCANVGVHQQEDDKRLDAESLPAPENTICLRPFTEMTFDYAGDVRMCCHDWKGHSCIGNLKKDGLKACVERWIRARTDLFVNEEGYPEMRKSAPERCLNCKFRYEHHGWDMEILAKTRRHCIQAVKQPHSMTST
jgi:hypothetical protein